MSGTGDRGCVRAPRDLRAERGEMSLTGLLVSMALFAIVSWATITTYARSETLSRTAQTRGAAQEDARRASDQLARELRNLASPTPALPQAIDRMGPQDLIFQLVSPAGTPPASNPTNVMRVRWCLSGTTLRRMEQPPSSFATGVPGSAQCDGSGWSNAAVVSRDVTNGTRPVFSYNAPTATDVTAVHTDLWVDPDPGTGAGETEISSGVFLRNQNRRPVAAASVVSGGGTGTLVLNGTASYDPEGDTLTYQWFRNGTPVAGATTPVFRLTGLPPGSTQSMTLRVADPAGLDATSAPAVGTA